MEDSRKQLARELTDILRNARKEYEDICIQDRIEQVSAGATSIKTKGFASSARANDARACVNTARARAFNLIDRELNKAQTELVAAPSAEAANYVSSISGRSDLTADEVKAGLSRYREHSAQKAIRAAAYRSGLKEYAGRTDAETYLADLRTLKDDVSKTYAQQMNGNLSAGAASFAVAGYESFANTPGGDAFDALTALGGQ